MQIIADLHIHSKYSRACSRDLVLEHINEYCQMKGVRVIATGDFTHPEWYKELKEKLVEQEKGLYVLRDKNCRDAIYRVSEKRTDKDIKGDAINRVSTGGCTRFLCSTEIACIYSKGGKVRRLHVVVLAPSLEAVRRINNLLERRGVNLKSDGRPILGMDVQEMAKICFEADEKCMIIPAHIWTPWFAMFGSKSGFDSIQECWGEMSHKIYAIETGLSSDPPMNWRVKNLDGVSITSNSDAHSLPNIAREANVFEINENKLSYSEICRIIKDKNPSEFLYTIEFYPEEGMYHFDGHRECKVSFAPSESKKNKNICPVCKKLLTIGVMNRVEELAESNRGEDYKDTRRVPFKKLIELDKIIAESLGIKSRNSKQVQNEYKNLIDNFGTEFEVLLKTSYEDLKKAALPQIVEGIKRMREGRIYIQPGFDGQYGEIKIFEEKERLDYQKSLF